MKKDSILQNFYYSKLPKAQKGFVANNKAINKSQKAKTFVDPRISEIQNTLDLVNLARQVESNQTPQQKAKSKKVAKDIKKYIESTPESVINPNFNFDFYSDLNIPYFNTGLDYIGSDPASRIRSTQLFKDQLEKTRELKEQQARFDALQFIQEAYPDTPESERRRKELNNQKAASDPDNYRIDDQGNLVIKSMATKDEWNNAFAIQTPEFVETAAFATPSGRDFDAGQTGAHFFVNTMPGIAPITSAGRVTQFAMGQNPYGFNNDGIASNILPTLFAAGDIAGIGSIKMLPGGKDLASRTGQFLTEQTPLKNTWKLNPYAGKVPFLEGNPNWLKGWPKDYSDPTKIDFSGMSKFGFGLKKGTKEYKLHEKLNKWYSSLSNEERYNNRQYYYDQSNKLMDQGQLKRTGLSKLFDIDNLYQPGVYSNFVAPLKHSPNVVFKFGREPFAGQTADLVLSNQLFKLSDPYIGLPFHSQQIGNKVVSLMPKVLGEGTSFGIVNKPQFEIPRAAAADMAWKLRRLNQLGIYADWKGNNFMFDPNTNKLSVFDLNTTPFNHTVEGFGQRFATRTNLMGENPATIMKQNWHLSEKPPRSITLENIPEEIGGYTGPESGITAADYQKYIIEQQLKTDLGNILRTEGVPDPRSGGAYKAPADKLTWKDPNTGKTIYELEAANYNDFKTPKDYKDAQKDMFIYKRNYLQKLIDQRNANLASARLLGEYGKQPKITSLKGFNLNPKTQNLLGQLGEARFTDGQMYYTDFFGKRFNVMPGLEINDFRPLGRDVIRNKKSEYFMITPNKYGGSTYANGGMIEDNRGQWAHPGKNTRIRSSNITMKGIDYPVLAKANNGMSTVMQPGQDYYFPGADYVDEFPIGFNRPLTFLEPNSPKLPLAGNRSEVAISVGGENGEPAFLIPSFKYGKPILGPSNNPYAEFRRTREHLGGPFKTWQEADEWERNIRHPYVEKGQALPTPLRRWGKDYAYGGPLVDYYAGRMNHGEMFKEGGSVREKAIYPTGTRQPLSLNAIISQNRTDRDNNSYSGGISKFAAGGSTEDCPCPEFNCDCPPGYGTATRRDSIDVRNSAIANIKWIKQHPEYRQVTDPKSIKQIKSTNTFADPTKPYLQQLEQSNKNIQTESKKKENYRKVIDKNKFKQREISFGTLNPKIPPTLYDKRIQPQDMIIMEGLPKASDVYPDNPDIKGTNIKAYDVVQIPQYDPIAVTPWDMLTPKEQKIRIEKYGTQGTPYAIPNIPSVQTSTVVNAKPQVSSVQQPSVQKGKYRVEYFDPSTGKETHRLFMTQAESDAFADELSKRNLHGVPSAGNITQRVEYARGGQANRFYYNKGYGVPHIGTSRYGGDIFRSESKFTNHTKFLYGGHLPKAQIGNTVKNDDQPYLPYRVDYTNPETGKHESKWFENEEDSRYFFNHRGSKLIDVSGLQGYYEKPPGPKKPPSPTEQKRLDDQAVLKNTVQSFYNQWYGSPMHEEMLRKSLNKGLGLNLNKRTKQKTEDRLATINNDMDVYLEPLPEGTFDMYIAGQVKTANPGLINISPFSTLPAQKSTSVHEGAHVTDLISGIPKKDIKMMQKYANFNKSVPDNYRNVYNDEELANFRKYVSDPTETRARILNGRYELNNSKIYNPFTEKLNKQSFEKGEKENKRFKDINDQLRSIYTDDQILDLYNSISKKDNNQLLIAKYGINTDISIPQLPTKNSPLLQFYYNNI